MEFEKFVKRVFNPIRLVLLMVVVAISLGVIATSCDNSSQSAQADINKGGNKPISLAGHWHQTKNGIPNTTMSADITSDHIEVTLKLGDVSGPFWIGTFDATPSTSTILSHGDTEKMDLDLLASNEKDKEFTYKNGDLSYQFSIMGESTIVHLSK